MKKQTIRPYIYILPSLMLALLFVYYPFIRSVISSFFNVRTNGSLGSFAGLDNYRKLLEAGIFQESLSNTFLFMLLFVPINLAFIFLLVLLTEKKRKGCAIFETVFMLPMAMGMSSAALLFKYMFNPTTGVINRIFHSNIQWNNEALPAMFSVVFLGVFLDVGLDYILLLSAMRNQDKGPIEAAMVDGASAAGIFWRIKLPAITPTLSFILFVSIKDALLISAPIMVMTEGGPYRSTQTIVYYYYIEAFRNSSYSIAAAISTLVFIIAGVIILIAGILEKRMVEY